MILSKKLTMSLLCSCLLHSYCGGMEQSQKSEENNKERKNTTHVMDDFYDEAILHLRFHIQDPNNPVHVSAATIQLQLASERGHLLAEKLLPFVKASFQRILNKSEDTRETITALCAIRFSAGYFEDGFNTLLTLLRYKCNDMCNLIDLIVSEKLRSAFLFNKFKILGDSSNEKSVYSKSDINNITQTFLDNFTFTDIYKDYYLEIQPHTQAAIGKIFIEASLNTPESNSSVISGSGIKGLGVFMPNSTNYYFLEGVKFCIFAAKQNDHDAYETLAKALRITKKYEYFFVQIYDLFKTGDEQAQELFNRIAFHDNQVLLGFDKYINKLEICSHNPGESTAVFDKVMINYNRYVNSQNPDVTRHSAVPLPSVVKDLTDKTTIQGVQGGGTTKALEEAKLSPEEVKQQKEYDDAMKLREENPSAWLWALLDVIDTSTNRKVIAELNEIRQLEGYKNPSKAKENDYGRILKEHEKTKGKEWFDRFDQLFIKKIKKAKNHNFSDDDISKAALALDKAYRYGNLAAIEYVKKLKKLNSYKNSKTTPLTNSRDRLASTFAALSAIFSHHIFAPNKENPSTEPLLQSSPQKGETQKTNNNNHNSNVGASGYSPKSSVPHSSVKEKKPRETKVNQENSNNTLTSSARREKVLAKSSVNNDIAIDWYNRGVMHLQCGHGHEAFACFQIAATNGHANSKYRVGIMYLEGKFVNKDVAEAFKYIKEAADQKVIEAIAILGRMYLYGIGVTKDENKGFRLINEAAMEGYLPAELRLGYLYLSGIGVPKDEEKAFKLIKTIADRGVDTAQHMVGLLYLRGEGVEANALQAIIYLKKVAVQKHPGALNLLGSIYFHGIGVEPDKSQAFTYFQSSSDLGDPEGQHNLARMYDLGIGVEKDPVRAKQLYQQSAEQGFDPIKAQKSVDKFMKIHEKQSQGIISNRIDVKPKTITNTQSEPLPQIQPQPQSAPAPVLEISPIVEETHSINTHSDTLLGSKKRRHKQNDKKKDMEYTPALQMIDDQLPMESREESIVPSDGKTKSNKTLQTHRKTLHRTNTHSHMEALSSSLESIEEGSGNKENLISLKTPKTEVRERKTLHRSQSHIPPSSASKFSEGASGSKGMVNTNEITKNEAESRKTIRRTRSLNQFSTENTSEEFSVKKEKEKKKNKAPVTKTSLKDHLSPKKKLERRNSEKELALSMSEETSDYTSSETSASDKPLEDLFKQDGKRDDNLKYLKRLLNNRDLIKASDIKLNRSIVVRALRELGPNGKKIITWNFETPGNKNSSIIRADIIRTPDPSKNHELPTLNIHLHSRQGKWYEDANIKEHFLKFICACDPSVKALVASFQKNNTNG